MKILIDADGCPVVDIALRVAAQAEVRAVILCDTAHEFYREDVETVTVSKGADSVDFALVNRVEPGDIAVTQDYGLAAMCLAKGACPIRQDGLLYGPDNMDRLLEERYTAGKLRRAGGRVRGPKKRTSEQDRDFEAALRNLIKQRENG